MLKTDLREQYLQLRKNITSEQLLNASLNIANKLLELPIWEFDYFHIFLPISDKKEIDTTFILSILQGKDKNVVLPKIYSHSTLKHFLLTDNTRLEINEWGIPEPLNGIEIMPNQLDVVLVPLLTFDQKGNRVGYGKGFYDKFLYQCREDVLKVGLSYFEPEERITDADEKDVALDYCITPNTIYNFSLSAVSE